MKATAHEWFKGSVLLANETVISGEITYPADEEVLFLKIGDNEDAMMVIPAFRILSFSFYEKESSSKRTFVTFRNSIGSATVYQFYEVLTEGIISVLRKQQNLWYSFRTEKTEFDYFVLINEEIIPMKRFRWHIYPALRKSSPELRDFAKRNRINIMNMPDVIRFVNYYNNAQPAMASKK
jgi:hypothetical protein